MLKISRLYKQDGVPFRPKRYRPSNKDVNSVWARNIFRTKVKRDSTIISSSAHKLHLESRILLRNNNNNNTLFQNTTLYYGKSK